MASENSRAIDIALPDLSRTATTSASEGLVDNAVGGDMGVNFDDDDDSVDSNSSNTNDSTASYLSAIVNGAWYADDHLSRLQRRAVRRRNKNRFRTRAKSNGEVSASSRDSSPSCFGSRADVHYIEQFEANEGTSQALKNIWSAVESLRRRVKHYESLKFDDGDKHRGSRQRFRTNHKSLLHARKQERTLQPNSKRLKGDKDDGSRQIAKESSSDVNPDICAQSQEVAAYTKGHGSDSRVAENAEDMFNSSIVAESEEPAERTQQDENAQTDDVGKSSDDANYDHDDKFAERVFKLEVQYFHEKDNQQLNSFYDDQAYLFIKARWNDLRSDGESNKQRNTLMLDDVAPGEVDLLEITIESHVFHSFIQQYGRYIARDATTPVPSPAGSIYGPISFHKPFRWLIQHRHLFEQEIRSHESTRGFQASMDSEPINMVAASQPGPAIAGDEASPKDRSTGDFEYDLHAQLQYLLEFLQKHLSKEISRYEEARAGRLRTITFDSLWMLYDSGDIIFTPHRQLLATSSPSESKPGAGPLMIPRHGLGFWTPQAYKIISVIGGRPFADQSITPRKSGPHTRAHAHLRILCYFVDIGDNRFDCVTNVLEIGPFDGEKAITELAYYPLSYASPGGVGGEVSMREFLLARGKSFVNVSEASHKLYNGPASYGSQETEEIDTPVIIDFALAYQNVPYWRPPFSRPEVGFFTRDSRSYKRELFEIVVRNETGAQAEIYWAFQTLLINQACEAIGKNMQAYPALGSMTVGSAAGDPAIPKIIAAMEATGDILLLPGTARAFALRNRKWVSLDLTLVQETRFEDGWNDLVIPPTHKDMIRAVIESHAAGSRTAIGMTKGTTEVDIVHGKGELHYVFPEIYELTPNVYCKGKGCIILLHGEPGVGKTSTAECAAAFTKRPLFPITCSDIGYEPDEVERSLQKYLTLAQKWGCIMLLDDADVFLAGRSSRHNIKRNGLVSVFLRILEYYPGVLFLTTNRVGSFDDAFRSRLHLTLYYPKLDEKQTIQIFEINIRRVTEFSEKRVAAGRKGIEIHEEKIIKFAKRNWETLSWNGRQIRNAFQTAIALADFEIRDDEEKLAVLGKKQFKTIAKNSREFDNYLYLTHGGVDEATNARRENVRWDYEIELRPDKKPDLIDSSSDEGESSSSSSGGSSESDSSSGGSSSSDSDDIRRRKMRTKKAKGKGKKSRKRDVKSERFKLKKRKDKAA